MVYPLELGGEEGGAVPLYKISTPTPASGNLQATQPGKPSCSPGLLGRLAVQMLDFWCSRALQNKWVLAKMYQKIKRLQACREVPKNYILLINKELLNSAQKKAKIQKPDKAPRCY